MLYRRRKPWGVLDFFMRSRKKKFPLLLNVWKGLKRAIKHFYIFFSMNGSVSGQATKSSDSIKNLNAGVSQ